MADKKNPPDPLNEDFDYLEQLKTEREMHLKRISDYEANRGREFLQRARTMQTTPGVREQRLAASLSDKEVEIESIQDASDMSSSAQRNAIASALEQKKRLAEKLQREQEAREYSAMKRFTSMVSSSTSDSAISSSVAQYRQSPQTMGGALKASRMSPFELSRQQQQNSASIHSSRGDLESAASNVSSSSGEQNFIQMWGQQESRMRRQAELEQAATIQRKEGRDIQSVLTGGQHLETKIRADQDKRDVQAKVSGGNVGNFSEEMGKLIKVEQDVVDAFKNFQRAVEENAEIIDRNSEAAKVQEQRAEELGKAYESLKGRYNEQHSTVQEMKKQGMDTPGSEGPGLLGTLVSTISGLLGNTGRIGLQAAGVYRYGAVTSELQRGDIRASYAGIANSQYDDALAGAHGDMSALRRSSSGVQERASAAAKEMREREDAASKWELRSKGLILADQAAQAYSKAFDPTSVKGMARDAMGVSGVGTAVGIGSAVLEGTAAIAPGAADLINQGIGYSKGIPQGQAALAAYQQRMDLENKLNQVDDGSSQKYRDYTASLAFSTRGLGNGRTSRFAGRGGVEGTDFSFEAPTTPSEEHQAPTSTAVGYERNAVAEAYIRSKESMRQETYDDATGKAIGPNDIPKGFATVGIGHKLTQSQRDKIIRSNGAVTMDQSEEIFQEDMKSHTMPWLKNLKRPINDEMRTAITSYAFNAGPYAKPIKNIVNAINEDRPNDAIKEFLNKNYMRSNGEFNKGLAERRTEEAGMFKQGLLKMQGQSSVDVMNGSDGVGLDVESFRRGALKDERFADSRGRRNRVLADLMDMHKVNTVATETGMSPTEISHATAMGTQQLGAQFGGLSDIRRAGQLQRAGYMSSEQYFHSAGALSGVGGNNREIEEILKRAVSQGLDTSKNIAQMVSATVEMSRSAAEGGAQVSAGAGEMLGRGIEAAGLLPENMRVGVAAKAADIANETTGNKDYNIANVLNWGENSRNFKGASLSQLRSLNEITASEVEQLNQGGDGARSVAESRGISSLVYGKDGKIDKSAISKISGATAVKGERNSRFLMDGSPMGARIDEAARNGTLESLMETDSEVREYYNANVRSKKGGYGGAVAAELNLGRKTKKGTISDATGASAAVEDIGARSGAIADANVTGAGQKNIQDAFGGAGGLAGALTKLSQTLDPSKFAAATAQAAEKMNAPINTLTQGFGKSVTSFENSVTRLERVVTDFAAKLGVKPEMGGHQNFQQHGPKDPTRNLQGQSGGPKEKR